MDREELQKRFTEIDWREQPFKDAFAIRDQMMKVAEEYATAKQIEVLEKLKARSTKVYSGPIRPGHFIEMIPAEDIDQAIAELKPNDVD